MTRALSNSDVDVNADVDMNVDVDVAIDNEVDVDVHVDVNLDLDVDVDVHVDVDVDVDVNRSITPMSKASKQAPVILSCTTHGKFVDVDVDIAENLGKKYKTDFFLTKPDAALLNPLLSHYCLSDGFRTFSDSFRTFSDGCRTF